MISIIIASYNYARFLPEAIESALAQTHREIEVIVVDDGSTDNSVEIARRYDVRVIDKANEGVARTRNRGAAEARGEYLVFLDADDVLLPTFVERCLQAIGNGAFAYTQVEKFGIQTGLLHTRSYDGRALFDGNFIPVTALIRKRAFDAVGGFDASWPAHEDHELWARMFVRGFFGVYVEEPLMRYRFHGQGRNTLSQRQRDDLHVKLVTQYPRYGWRWIARHPLLTARSLLRR